MASESYLDPAELVTYYDTRRVLQLSSDTGATAVIADLSNSASAPYGRVLSAIRFAASELDSHCQQGKRYTRSTLEAIISAAAAAPADEGLQKRAALIKQLVADLAFGVLASRRGYTADSLKDLAPRYETALGTLERLANGIQIFDIDETITRGAPSVVQIGRYGYRPQANNRLFGIFEDNVRGPGAVNPYLFGRW
jgi:hypothetical protein